MPEVGGATPAHVQDYQRTVGELRLATSDQAADRLLATLIVRDAVHRQLTDGRRDAPATVEQIVQLDSELYELVSRSPHRQKLRRWRRTLAPGTESWWWYLDQEASHAQWHDWNWVWDGLAILLFAVGLALLAEMARRFLTGGPDGLSWYWIAIQALIALVVVGGALTKTGQALLARIFKRLPAYWWAYGRLAIAIGFVGLMLLSYNALPAVAQLFNNRGSERRAAGEMLTAQHSLERAILLQPEYSQAHYNLGLLHEDMLDYEAALAEYQYAAKGGLDTAYNNAARLLILMGRPAEAVTLLQGRSAEDQATQVQMSKNLAWAWVEQDAFGNALPLLQSVLALEPEHPAANCLLAITLEGLGRQGKATDGWNECVRLTGSAFPEEVRWRLLAQEKLQAAE